MIRIAAYVLPVLFALGLVWGSKAEGKSPTGISVTDTGSGMVDSAPPQPVLRPWSPQTRSRSQVVKSVLPSSVRVAYSVGGKVTRTASGVVLGLRDGKGYVITNAHVVERSPGEKGSFEILVDERGKSKHYAARVIAEGQVPEVDLAILEVEKIEGVRAAELVEDSDVELGDDVVVVGAPYGRGLSISSGIVSQLDWDDAGAARGFKTDAPIGYGASGGGVFRVPDGKLLAVVEGYRTAKVSFPMADKKYSFDVPMPGETFASPAAKVRAFLRDKGLESVILGGAEADAEESHASR